MSNGGEPALGHWPICDSLLGSAEEVAEAGFARDFRAQGELLWRLGNPEGGYWHLPAAHRTELLSRLIPLVPRLAVSPEPLITLERIFRLWHGPNPRESIARAVRVETYEPRPLEPGEEIYRVGGFCEEYVDWTRESNTPSAFLFGGALVALAGVCGFNLYVDRNADTLRLGTHYVIFTGRKGTGKSVGLDGAKELLQRVNHLVHPWTAGSHLPDFTRPNPFTVRFMPEDTNWRTIVGCLKSTPTVLQGFVTDTALASRDLQALLRAGGNQFFPPDEGVLLLDEAATIFGKTNFAVDRMIPGMNSVHGGRPYVYQTQSGGLIRLERPALVFAGCCPPDVLQTALTPALFQGGFMDRVNVIYHEPLPGPGRFATPRPRDPVVAAHLAYRLAELRRLSLLPFELVARPDAVRWYEEWYHAQREPEDPREISVARRGNHLWRYAAYIALGNGHEPWISLRDFEAAARIQDYELRCYRELLVALEVDPSAELMSHIERQLYRHDAIAPDGWMTRSDLFRLIRERKGLSPPTLRAIPYLESLEAAGRIRQRVNGAHRYFQLTSEAAADLDSRTPRRETPTNGSGS